MPNAMRVLTTHEKDSRTEPTAIALVTGLESRRPKRPLSANPMRGKIGMSQSCILVSERTDFVDFEGLAIFENRENDRQSDRGFRGGDHHHKEAENMPVHMFELVGKSDEAQIDGVQHQLNG